MDTRGKREEGLWNLACDIAVEYLIDSMDMKCLHRPQTPARRECYLRLKEKDRVMNAQSIYRCLQEEKLPEGRYLALWPIYMRITILIGRMRMTGPGWHRTGKTNGTECVRRWRRR